MFLKKEIEILHTALDYYLYINECDNYEGELTEETKIRKDYENTIRLLKERLEIILKNYEG